MAVTSSGLQWTRFGDFKLDRRTGELWRNGTRVVLPNQPFRLLAVLIQRPGELVTREELRQELWREDTFVDFEHSINACVRRLRDALGDSATAPRFIETVPQRGYRFIAAVEDGSPAPSEAEEGAPPAATLDRAEAATDPGASHRLRLGPLVSGAAVVALVLTLVAFLVGGSLPSSTDSAPIRSPTRLTSTSGLSTDPALSRDGNLLAYASDRAGADFDIYVQAVAGGDPLRLTNHPADESEPSFSPDGGHIVFSRRESGLYVVPALGGEPRLIARTPWSRTPRFSPDGRRISYWTGFPASVVAGGIRGALGSTFIVGLDGSPPREISTHLASARYPIWSPDGGHILFLGEEDADQKTHDWYIVPRDGGPAIKTGAVRALRAAGLGTRFPVPGTWSARENAVVFATNETDSSNIWQIPISASTGRVSGAPQPLTLGTALERGAIASDSGRIVFASIVENVDIWRVPVEANTGVATGALERVTDNAASDRLRNVSTDGSRVFFISSRTGRDEVWIKDLRTGEERQVTHAGVEEASASPDGSGVAYSRNDVGKRYIEVVRTAEGLSSKLCDGCYGPGGWSPGGKHLLYTTHSPFRLLLHDLVSGRQTELVTHPSWSLERPRFSPDGRWVAFHTGNSPNVRQLYAAPVSRDGPLRQNGWVPIVTDHGCHPSWSADGSLLYHFSFRDGSFCSWVQRVDPATNRPIGPPRAVQHLHQARLRAASGAAAFNDVQAGYLYMTLTEATGNVWMIDRRYQ